MLRRILVPLDTSPYTPVAVKTAAQMANEVSAIVGHDLVTLCGLGIVDLEQVPAGRYASVVNRDELLATARETSQHLLDDFAVQAHRLDIPESRVETHLTEGSPFRKIIHHHVFCDLVVMGERCSFPPVQNDYSTLEQLFHQSSRPIVLIPRKPRQVETVLMALDGTAASSRMMYAFAHLNPFPRARVVVVHARHEEDAHELKDFFQRVEQYLGGYKFELEQLEVERHVLQVLPELARERNAGAIAIGIHQEHFLEKLGSPLHLVEPPVERLLSESQVVLFTTH